MMKTIVIGLGNPCLRDDGLGIMVADLLRNHPERHDTVTVTEAYTGGLALMELMVGYDQAIVIDACTTGIHPAGTLIEMSLDDLTPSRNSTSTHDASLVVALETGKTIGLHLPSSIRFFGIEAGNTKDFGETLTEPVRRTVPALVAEVIATLNQEGAP
ncbi:MAG: hydrogenase maturation protease [Proteobacteria bacterium]|nr:hydrogenase maturation protease [Pseudomonadota bacterium]MBU1687197.1 hydrogenase maturation protease [Pseudomonadota bacterium]